MIEVPPLEDYSYEPENPPIDGMIPEVVKKFGPRTQIRWFKRFYLDLKKGQSFGEYYTSSEQHKGYCCLDCDYELVEFGTGVMAFGPGCCCRAQEGKN